ncbi:MAG: flagellar biosynthetic protein FliR, partial [Candidatus Anstonellales archaeon]
IHLIFIGVQFAGELIGNQMGFGMANILDPQSGLNSPVISQFQYFVAVMIFLSIDGHHWFFRALAQSFQILSPGEIFLQGGLFKHFVDLSGKVFQIGIKIIAPIMAILIFTQLALGIVARMVPQINLLISSFPLTIGLGLIVLGLSLEFLFPLIRSLFEHSGKNLVNVILPLMKR